MTEVLIKAENVSKKFCRDFKRSLWYGMKDIGRSLLSQDHSQDELRKDEFWAVKDISFEVRRGECLGLIGHNGAGKSTLLKMLNGLINPDQGKITMCGRIGALIELGAGFNPLLTGRENIYNNGAVLGFTKKEIDEKLDAIIEFSEIGEFIDAPVQNYSSGMKVRLGFAVAAQMEPDILLIDEVLAVGDIGFRIKCFNLITNILPKIAVIFVTHNMHQVARICDSLMLLAKGKINYNGQIGAGIEKYYESCQFDNIQKIENGCKIELEENVFNVEYKKPLSISFLLSIFDSIDLVEVVIIFYDTEFKPIAYTISPNFSVREERFNLDITLEKIQFSAGIYYANVIIRGYKSDNLGKRIILGRYINLFKLIVFNEEHIEPIPVILESNWQANET